MKRSLWFDASMLVLILIVSAIAATRERKPADGVTAAAPTAAISAESSPASYR